MSSDPATAVPPASWDPRLLEELKISCFTNGILIDEAARDALSHHGSIPLTVHEYTTTGGVTFSVGDVFINAPFDEPLCHDEEATLTHTADGFAVLYQGLHLPARALALPGYLRDLDAHGRPVTDAGFSHADRVRLSPIFGCSYSCQFCDIPGKKYLRRNFDQLLEALRIAEADKALPVSHVLMSGGTPSARDHEYYDAVCALVARSTSMPVDVMMPPRPDDPGFIDRLVDAGIYGFSINLEVFDDRLAPTITKEKARIGRDGFASTISRAVDRTGGPGRVRSLLLVGLEPEEKTLEGVEFLARLGCDPTLSPFRPSVGTPLVDAPAPTAEMLRRVYREAKKIVDRYGVKLGPRCIPCQHNTLTFPDPSGAYYYSSELRWPAA